MSIRTDPNYKPLPGHLGNLTNTQRNALGNLKSQLVNNGYFVPKRMDDATLLRFLRAREFDVPETRAMLLSAEQWRRDFGVDNIVANFRFTEKAAVDKYLSQYYHKTDKDGRPIYIQRVGKIDFDALSTVTTEDRQLRRFVLEYERFLTDRLPACSKAAGHPVETSCTITDLADASILSIVRYVDNISEASRISQDRYPECMGKFYIVNAPRTFSVLWKLIKPFLNEATLSKVEVVRSKYVAETLLAQIPEENLPVMFGGKCRCAGGCSLSDAGPWNRSR